MWLYKQNWSRALTSNVEKLDCSFKLYYSSITIQEWARCTELKKLHLSYNRLSETLWSPEPGCADPTAHFKTLAEAFPLLHTLILNFNHFAVPPPAVFMLPSLRRLKMEGCRITSFDGHISFSPTAYVQASYPPCPSLTLLDLTLNSLHSLPSELFTSIAPSLTSFDCSQNQLQTLPDSLCTLSALKYLNLDDNVSLRALPQNITRLSHLHTLSLLHCNNLEPLPQDILALPSLTNLSLPLWTFKSNDDATTNSPSFDASRNLAPLKQLKIHRSFLSYWPDLSKLHFTNLISLSLGELQSEDEFPVAILDLTGLQTLYLLGSLSSTKSYLPETLPRYPIGCQSSLTALKLERMIMRSHLPNWLLAFSNLREIVLFDTLEELPARFWTCLPNLTTARLASPLEWLPSEGLDRMTSLRSLYLEDTSITWLPAEIRSLALQHAQFPSTCQCSDIMADLDVEYFFGPKSLLDICRFSTFPPPTLHPTHTQHQKARNWLTKSGARN